MLTLKAATPILVIAFFTATIASAQSSNSLPSANDVVPRMSILGEEGSGSIRKHVFHKLLNERTEASRRGTRNNTRLTPDNYEFQMVGEETLGSGPAYVLSACQKKKTNP